MAKKNVKKGINMEKLNQIDKELEITMKDVQVRGIVEGSEMVEPTIPEEVMDEMVAELRESEEERIANMEEYFEQLREFEEDERIRKELEEEMRKEIEMENQEMAILNREIRRAE